MKRSLEWLCEKTIYIYNFKKIKKKKKNGDVSSNVILEFLAPKKQTTRNGVREKQTILSPFIELNQLITKQLFSLFRHQKNQTNCIRLIRPKSMRGGEWSIKILNCSQNFTFVRFARKIQTIARMLVLPNCLQLLTTSLSCQYCSKFCKSFVGSK